MYCSYWSGFKALAVVECEGDECVDEGLCR